MFVCTARSIPLINAHVTPEVYTIDKILNILSIDKKTVDPRIEGIFITSDDVSSRSLFKKFTEAMNSKNADNIVIFVDKKRKGSTLPEGFPGVNYYYSLPSKEALASAFSEIISKQNTVAAMKGTDASTEQAPAFEVAQFQEEKEQRQEPQKEEEKLTFSDEIGVGTTEEFAKEVISQPAEAAESAEVNRRITDAFPDVKEVDLDSAYLDRLEKATTTGELGDVLENITISGLIKDITEKNTTYAQVEDRIAGLTAEINSIMVSANDGNTLEDKLRAIRGIVYNRASVNAYGTSIIESYVHRMIDTVITTSTKYIKAETEKITEAVKSANVTKGGVAALESLKSNRYNAVLMLDTFIAELTNLENILQGLTSETISMFVDKEMDVTGNVSINADLRNKCAVVVGESTIESIKDLYSVLEKMPDQFNEIISMVKVTRKLVYALFESDQKLIEGYEKIISRLTLDGLSQSQIAKEFTDKSVRVWVGDNGSGITIIPYLFSKTLERENCNVLNIYLGDDYNLDAYGIKYVDLGTFVNEVPEGEFYTAAGKLSDVIMMEDIITAIGKATPYYRVINVIMHYDTEQLMMIANKSFAVYIVQQPVVSKVGDPLNIFRIFEGQHAMKFLVLNYGNKVVPEYFDQMGVSNSMDIMCVKIPVLPDIWNASIKGEDPYEYSSVRTAISELRRYV